MIDICIKIYYCLRQHLKIGSKWNLINYESVFFLYRL